MTLDQAKLIAGQQLYPHLIFRLPAWPVGVYSVIKERPMPVEAEVIEVKPKQQQGNLFD